jgi:hypothetical protein
MKQKTEQNKKSQHNQEHAAIKKQAVVHKSKKFYWRNLFFQVTYFLADSPVPEIVFASSLILSRWWLNSDFSYPIELIVPMLMFGTLGTVIYYVYRLIFGKGSAAHLAAILLLYSFYGYEYVQDTKIVSTFVKIIPSSLRTDFTQSIVLGLLLAVVAGALAWTIRWAIKHFSFFQRIQAYKVLLFAIIFIFSIQGVRFVERFFQIHKELSYHNPAPNIPKPANSSTQTNPDIYYLLFDRYTNADVLKNNFNYDNSDFVNFLASNGFVTRSGAYSNYPFTTPSVSSTMAMKYHDQFAQMFENDSNWRTLFPYRTILNDPPIAQILKQNCYTYNQVSSWWDFTRLRVKADNSYAKSFRLNIFGAHFYLSDLQRDILHKSILSPWLKKGISSGKTPIVKYDLDRNPRENFDAQLSSLKAISSRTSKSQPNFTFAHILAPHPPYVFDQNGSWPTYDNEANDNGVPEKTKYKNELTYINTRIKDLVSNIRATSPNAIIFIQADEGPYPAAFRGEMTAGHYYNPADLSLSEMKQKFGIMASYYMPGISQGEVGKINASVNVFPFILNHYLGYDLPMLPDCQFAMGNKFNVYNYKLVSGQLKGQPADPACKKYE